MCVCKCVSHRCANVFHFGVLTRFTYDDEFHTCMLTCFHIGVHVNMFHIGVST